MKILPLSVNNFARKCMIAVALTCPAKISRHVIKEFPKCNIEYFHPINKSFAEPKLTVVADTNFLGGIIHRYDDKSVQIIKNRIIKKVSKADYVLPIENNSNVYLETFGMFNANRPMGRRRSRPHLGLDIFVSPYSKKPQIPVEVRSPIDGIVISRKQARKSDNLISNAVTVLGIDGNRYSFDHLARETDYETHIPLPKLGAALKKGDKIGYVGATGETTLWHLHFIVMTDKKLAEQKASQYWQELAKQSKYCSLKGQVNPLDKNEAGIIAELLSNYKKSR